MAPFGSRVVASQGYSSDGRLPTASTRAQVLVTQSKSDSLVVPLPAARAGCPSWCATRHGVHVGEEDWLHLSEPLPVAEGVSAWLCLSIDPLTSAQDGPYMVIGSREYTLPQAQALGASLLAMASQGADVVTRQS
jgi:hypothetical protein